MTHFSAIILGLIEGLTEFIPVSSSGHLIIARHFLGQSSSSDLTFDAVLQLATSCALLVYFWKDILNILLSFGKMIIGKTIEQKEKIMIWAIILGTIPAIVIGLLLEKDMETIFRNTNLVALTLILGSLLFWYAQTYKIKNNHFLRCLPTFALNLFRINLSKSLPQPQEDNNNKLTIWKGIKIGFFQCLALVPGVSRSGATISGGLLSGLTQDDAVRFSFLLSIPILFGAGLLKLFEARHMLLSAGFGGNLLLGSVVAFITGLLSISFLIRYLRSHNLNVFIWYRVALAIFILFLF